MAIFNWFKKEEETDNPTRTQRTAKPTRDFTDSLQVNEALTRGLYFGDYPGLKLASSLAMAPIKIPVFFQGFPIPSTEDDAIGEILEDVLKQFIMQMQQIHIQRRREGTVWIWPKYSKDKLLWEFIPDMVVTDIIRSIDTGEVISIIVEENLVVTVGYDKKQNITRRRVFTEQRVEVTYSGGVLPANLSDKSMRNPIGMLPIAFSCEADGDDIRGHSIYGRIVSDLKSYHDIDLALSILLAKFKTKLAIGTDNIEEFAKANGYDDAAAFFDGFSIADSDIIIYQKDVDEKPELITAALQAFQAYMSALKLKFRKIVEGTGIPEIAWGLKTEGNLASVTENMSTMLMYVRGDQRECTNPWIKVFTASLKLLMTAGMVNKEFTLTVKWNDLDAINDETKSIIFKNFTEGLSKVMAVAGCTKEQVYKLWRMNFPSATEEDFELFKTGLDDMAVFKAVAAADPLTALDMAGLVDREKTV